jgi:predicted dehydrogenase
MRKVSWGVLGVSKMAVERTIPAMQQCALGSIDAIASRDAARAAACAARLGIARSYGSYEALLADPGIEAVYNPLPNHMHVDWTLKALAAGKNVLCEKPLGMSAGDAARLEDGRKKSGRLVMEAFMVRTHPQWLKVREIIASGRIGTVRAVSGVVTYDNPDPANIRNILDVGGGGMMDIGCYMIYFSRFAFAAEPTRAISLIDRDPTMKTDRLASVLLQFPQGQASFVSSTQLARAQRFQILGTAGHITVEVPINAPHDRPTRLVVDDGRDVLGTGAETIELPVCNQYTVQGDAFSACVRNGAAPAVSLADSLANMRVIDAVFRSEKSGGWEEV